MGVSLTFLLSQIDDQNLSDDGSFGKISRITSELAKALIGGYSNNGGCTNNSCSGGQNGECSNPACTGGSNTSCSNTHCT